MGAALAKKVKTAIDKTHSEKAAKSAALKTKQSLKGKSVKAPQAPGGQQDCREGREEACREAAPQGIQPQGRRQEEGAHCEEEGPGQTQGVSPEGGEPQENGLQRG